MKKSIKRTLLGIGLAVGVFAISGCTASFSRPVEKARIAASFETGISTFTTVKPSEEAVEYKAGTGIYQIVDLDKANSTLKSINDTANANQVFVPDIEYFKEMDKKVFDKALEASGLQPADYSDAKFAEVLKNYGYLKFISSPDGNLWDSFDATLAEFRAMPNDFWEKCPSVDYVNIYKSSINSIVDKYRSTITTKGGLYGSYGDAGQPIQLEKKTWGEAWGLGGHLIEGLIVYPVVWMLDGFGNLFSGKNPAAFSNGVPQILSLLVVTIIVRLFIFLVTIKSTMSQQKMTALQPELTKIQQKYPNANTNQSQKQRMAEEQMRLYKKHGVNPLSSLLVLIVQFPIFIGVWGAMNGSALLSTGTFLKLDLSASIWECLKMGPKNHAGWWTALVLILLMSAGQFFSMKVPQWLQKAKAKKVARLTKNPAEKSQNRTANIISYVMLVMIIIMGFTLPAAMGVYWFIGALFSLVQSVVMNFGPTWIKGIKKLFRSLKHERV